MLKRQRGDCDARIISYTRAMARETNAIYLDREPMLVALNNPLVMHIESNPEEIAIQNEHATNLILG